MTLLAYEVRQATTTLEQPPNCHVLLLIVKLCLRCCACSLGTNLKHLPASCKGTQPVLLFLAWILAFASKSILITDAGCVRQAY